MDVLLSLHRRKAKPAMKHNELHDRFVGAGCKFHHAERSTTFMKRNWEILRTVPCHGTQGDRKRTGRQPIKRYGIRFPYFAE